MIDLYTKNGCIQCKKSEMVLRNLGVDFNEINITGDEEKIEWLKSLSVHSMPVVMKDEKILFTGFRPDKLKALV